MAFSGNPLRAHTYTQKRTQKAHSTSTGAQHNIVFHDNVEVRCLTPNFLVVALDECFQPMKALVELICWASLPCVDKAYLSAHEETKPIHIFYRTIQWFLWMKMIVSAAVENISCH